MARNKANQLYVLQCNDGNNIKVKIGVTSNIEQRIKSLQTKVILIK